MQQYANPIDAPAVPLTRGSAKWLQERIVWADGDVAALEAEIASLQVLLGDARETAARLRGRLGSTVSLLPPLDGEPAKEPQQMPLESAACEAAREQQRLVEESKAGRDPYGPSTLPDLPPFATGHVQVPDGFASSIAWTGPAADGEDPR